MCRQSAASGDARFNALADELRFAGLLEPAAADAHRLTLTDRGARLAEERLRPTMPGNTFRWEPPAPPIPYNRALRLQADRGDGQCTFGAMITGYNGMRASLAQLVGDITANAASLGSATTQMASTSEDAGRAVGEIASAVTEVADGAERQVRMVESTRDAVQSATRAAEASALTAQSTAAAAEDARRVAEDGVQAAEQASAVMREVAASSQQHEVRQVVGPR